MAQDPSNFDTNFERVRWRKLMPHLAELGMDAARLADLADSMRATRETLNERLFNWLEAYADWHDYGVLCLPREAFLHLPEAYQGRLLSYFTRHFGGLAHPKKRAQIARLGAAVAANERGGATLGGVFAHWRRDMMFLGREAAACDASVTDFSDVIWDRRFAINGQNVGAYFTIAALGPAGVQQMRDDGMIFDDAVPAAYYAALPGLWQDGKLQHGLMPGQDVPVQLRNICELGFARDTLGVAQDW